MKPSPTSTNHNKSIQGLRGAAALVVVIYHLHYMSAKAGLTVAYTGAMFANVGPYAVLLFFCISGYLISDTLSRHGDVRRFAFNRFARIYPLFLVLHLIMFTFGPLMNYEWMGALRYDVGCYLLHFTSNVLLLPGLVDLPLAQKNAWSLSYEAAFYLLAGTIFAGTKRKGSATGLLMWVLGWLACVEACLLHSEFVFFAIGALVWWIEKRGWLCWPSLGPMSLIACTTGLFCFGHDQVWAAALLVLPFFADVVRQSGWVSAILHTQTLNWMGKVSYSLYLVHPFVLDPLRRVCVQLADPLGTHTMHTLFVFAGSGLALVAAALAYEWIEVRLTRRLLFRPVTLPT